ncbi:RNA-directed DNA polymerase, eukaryota [Tanacetum coccineum]
MVMMPSTRHGFLTLEESRTQWYEPIEKILLRKTSHTIVERRGRKQQRQQNQTISYFFTDIPAGANEANIWKAFAKQGRVCDVYLAKKKTINGSDFGFARFLNVSNPKSFEKILNSTTTLGHHRLKVNIARYQRGFANSDHHVRKAAHTNKTNQHPHSTPSHYHPQQPGKCYATALNGNSIPTKQNLPPTPITIHACPDLTSELHHCLVVELATIDTFTNLHIICDEVGLPVIKLKYLGGVHALLVLEPSTDPNTVLSNISMHDCFKNIQPWNNKFYLKSRLAWISIEGLPPQAWHESAFTRLAGEWGEVIFPETCNTNSLNSVAGKVCIRTKCMEIIQHNMLVIIDDIHVCVRIRKLIGECNEICPAKKDEYDDHTSNRDDDSITNHDINTNGHESHPKTILHPPMVLVFTPEK